MDEDKPLQHKLTHLLGRRGELSRQASQQQQPLNSIAAQRKKLVEEVLNNYNKEVEDTKHYV